MLVHLGIHVAVGDEDVGPAIVVEVEKFYPEAEERNADRTKAGASRQVGELAVAIIVIEVVGVVGEIGLDDVGPAVVIVVGGVDAHAGLLASVARCRPLPTPRPLR